MLPSPPPPLPFNSFLLSPMQSVFVSKTLVRVHLSPLDQQSPTFLTLGTSFVEDNSMDWGKGGWFGMIQAHYVYCILHFCYYYISSISDHQALDPGGWGPLSSSRASQVVLEIEEPPCKSADERDASSIPELGRSSGGGHGNPLQYSCLETSMDRGAWWATVHGVTKGQTRLSN